MFLNKITSWAQIVMDVVQRILFFLSFFFHIYFYTQKRSDSNTGWIMKCLPVLMNETDDKLVYPQSELEPLKSRNWTEYLYGADTCK